MVRSPWRLFDLFKVVGAANASAVKSNVIMIMLIFNRMEVIFIQVSVEWTQTLELWIILVVRWTMAWIMAIFICLSWFDVCVVSNGLEVLYGWGLIVWVLLVGFLRFGRRCRGCPMSDSGFRGGRIACMVPSSIMSGWWDGYMLSRMGFRGRRVGSSGSGCSFLELRDVIWLHAVCLRWLRCLLLSLMTSKIILSWELRCKFIVMIFDNIFGSLSVRNLLLKGRIEINRSFLAISHLDLSLFCRSYIFWNRHLMLVISIIDSMQIIPHFSRTRGVVRRLFPIWVNCIMAILISIWNLIRYPILHPNLSIVQIWSMYLLEVRNLHGGVLISMRNNWLRWLNRHSAVLFYFLRRILHWLNQLLGLIGVFVALIPKRLNLLQASCFLKLLFGQKQVISSFNQEFFDLLLILISLPFLCNHWASLLAFFNCFILTPVSMSHGLLLMTCIPLSTLCPFNSFSLLSHQLMNLLVCVLNFLLEDCFNVLHVLSRRLRDEHASGWVLSFGNIHVLSRFIGKSWGAWAIYLIRNLCCSFLALLLDNFFSYRFFDSKTYYTAPNLNSLGLIRFKINRLFLCQYKRTKLW